MQGVEFHVGRGTGGPRQKGGPFIANAVDRIAQFPTPTGSSARRRPATASPATPAAWRIGSTRSARPVASSVWTNTPQTVASPSAGPSGRRAACAEPGRGVLLGHADDAVIVAAHPGIGQERGAARQDLVVGGGAMGVGADLRGGGQEHDVGRDGGRQQVLPVLHRVAGLAGAGGDERRRPVELARRARLRLLGDRLQALQRPRAEHAEPPRVREVVVRRPAGEVEELVEDGRVDGLGPVGLVRPASPDGLLQFHHDIVRGARR